jgi:hypothetical protein
MERKHKLPSYNSKNLMTLLRFIASKKEYEGDKIDENDIFILNFCYLDITTLMENDCKFGLKNQRKFVEFSLILARINSEFKQQHHLRGHFQQTWFERKNNPAIMSPRAYLGLKNNKEFQRIYRRATVEKVLTSPFSPARFIGVGYKDKGTCRKLQEDGSQSWQDIASQNLKDHNDKLREVSLRTGLDRLVGEALLTSNSSDLTESRKILTEVVERNEKMAKTISPKTNLPPWKDNSPYQKNLKIRKRLGTLPSWQRKTHPSLTGQDYITMDSEVERFSD